MPVLRKREFFLVVGNTENAASLSFVLDFRMILNVKKGG